MNTKKSSTKRNRLLLTGAIAAAVLSILGALLLGREKPVEVTIESVFRKEVIHLVTATGKIQPETDLAISPDVSGEIIELPVSEGQQVKKGALLFKIQPDVYINQVEQSLAQLNQAKSLSLETRSKQVKAEDDFRKASILFKEKLISESDYISAKTNAEASRAAYQSSQYAIAQNRSLLDQNQDRLKKTVVPAPISGSIIALQSKLGERVVGTGQFPGTEVMRLANLDSMQVEVEVNENDIVNVRVGNPVSVTVDAYGKRVFRGTVHEIANSAISTAAGTQEEATNFSVKVRIFNHERLLKPGMSATADIESERVPDALVVPIQSVTLRTPKAESGKKKEDAQKKHQEESRQGVFVFNNDRVRFVSVATGTTDNTHIVITGGLKEGDRVVSGSYTAISTQLQDGEKVRLVR
ncbi:MAG: efflux transporter periplasmic adaptor subunit [Pelodictyon luteolum]|uniref:Efflux transporter periplasmic adaptor subunit n=1 Tax=Pelodictyon luteolum TaxID=1100 RepID=A0A165LQZ3_PELLU|nr:efflux RND transporter periplasmic adaptor subunit [Pelodictyon luteolum]KZK74320.1 MAG: efflux transporter periplasmic adaptor subunit [Pelodictyon luteolum]